MGDWYEISDEHRENLCYNHRTIPKSFLELNGFTQFADYCNEYDIREILKHGIFSYVSFSDTEHVPFLNHAGIYRNPKTNVKCLVYLPFEPVSIINQKIMHWAKKKRLKAVMQDKS